MVDFRGIGFLAVFSAVGLCIFIPQLGQISAFSYCNVFPQVVQNFAKLFLLIFLYNH